MIVAIDAAGAFVTAILTFFLLAGEIVPTGLPTLILQFMAAVAALYGVFGVIGFVLKLAPQMMLRTLAVLNLVYAVAAIAVCAINRDQLTPVGTIYFAVECAILFALAAFEWSVANNAPNAGESAK